MTAALPTDVIVQRCDDRKWQYPEPIEDLDAWVNSNWDEFDPTWAHRIYWPDRPYQPGMEILVVDGGTTQGPVIARNNPDARVTVTVIDEASRAHAIYLKNKYRLSNLELQHLSTEKVPELDRSFDLVIASGVLQQAGYLEAQLGMKAVAQVLRPEGVAAFLLFSRYLPGGPAAGLRPHENNGSLHSSGVNFNVDECLDLVEGAGLVFQDWLVKSPYNLPGLTGRNTNDLLTQIENLPERTKWSVLEPLRNQSGCHLFAACRPERPAQNYQIDFDAPEALEYVPAWRIHAGLDGRHAVRPGWSVPLGDIYREMAEKTDGHRTIRQIAGVQDLNSAATTLIKELWRMDFLTIGFGGAGT